MDSCRYALLVAVEGTHGALVSVERPLDRAVRLEGERGHRCAPVDFDGISLQW